MLCVEFFAHALIPLSHKTFSKAMTSPVVGVLLNMNTRLQHRAQFMALL